MGAKRIMVKSGDKMELKAGGAGALSVLLRLRSDLEEVLVANEQLTPSGAIYIGHGIANSTSLKMLDLSSNLLCGKEMADDPPSKYQPDGFVTMCRLLATNTSLQTLDLSDNSFGEKGAIALTSALTAHPSLTCLKIADSALRLGGWKAMAAYVAQAARLRELDINSNLESNPEMRPMEKAMAAKEFGAAVGKSGSLTNLNLSMNEFGAAGCKLLATLFGCATLEVVDLSSVEFGTAAAGAMAPYLASHKALRELNVSSDKVGSSAAFAAAIGASTTLAKVDLSDNELDAPAVCSIARRASRSGAASLGSSLARRR